jgi:signal transduction histidine kinase
MSDDVEDVTNQPEVLGAHAVEPPPDPRELRHLHEALVVRDRFLGALGHELRNSIAPMLLIAEQLHALAADPGAPPQLAARAAMLDRSLAKLGATIDQVSEVAGLHPGRLALAASSVDLAAIVVEVCGEATRHAAAAGVVIVIDAPVAVPGMWDRARLKKIVACLVSNAIRHGGGRVELAVGARDADAVLVVRDHGPGLDPARLARLFDPFEGVTAHGSGGFGIGLWVVKTLCEAMRGSVTVEPATNGGARFSVVLPRG